MGSKKTEQAAAGAGTVRPHVVRSFTLRNLVKNRARSIVTIVGSRCLARCLRPCFCA